MLPPEFLADYLRSLTVDIKELISKLPTKGTYATTDFEHYVQRAATYSSNIEGNSIDFDTFLKNKRFNIKSKPKEMAEIEDLVKAYNFALANELNEANFLHAHKLLSRHILSLKNQRGTFRDQQVGIFSQGRMEYMAVEPAFVQQELSKLFADIQLLLSGTLSEAETFYYASLIHLMFEKIHPFMDGNGRAGRLLEKWFLYARFGEQAWAIPSEMHYALNRTAYYQHIHIGVDYYSLHWERCLPFLLMLPEALV